MIVISNGEIPESWDFRRATVALSTKHDTVVLHAVNCVTYYL